MRQLLEIENIPIKLEVKVTHPRWKRSDDFETQSVSAYNGRARADFSVKRAANTPVTNAVQAGQADFRRSSQAQSDVYDNRPQQVSFALARAYNSAAAGMLNNKSTDGTPETEFVQAGLQNTMLSTAANNFVPQQVKPMIRGESHISHPVQSYESDRASFDARQGLVRADYEFIPGNIEYTVAQRNEVRFTYVGTPIYVPKSADPDYEEPTYL